MRYTWRFYMILVLFAALFCALGWRLFDLTVIKRRFLLNEGQKRSIRVQETPAHRGMIVDRLGSPLAVSTPVASIWINPQEMEGVSDEQWDALAQALHLKLTKLKHKYLVHKGKHFTYLKRRVNPEVAEKVLKLGVPGVHVQQEYRRFYPKGAMAAQWVGLTNIDDHGVEGMELAYNQYLEGSPDKFLVVKDRQGAVVEQLRQLAVGQQGQTLTLSMDHRIQYVAYHELDKAMRRFDAASGSVVVLNVKTGEVLAMANVPSTNPNNVKEISPEKMRNRAVTDTFEPGSTIKPFSALAAIESGRFTMESVVDTQGGKLKVDEYMIEDHGKDFGRISLAEVLKKSSNVGIAKIALALRGPQIFNALNRIGFGQSTLSGFPGEVPGHLQAPREWKDADIASLSFGYGMSVTALQLAQAFAVLANDGIKVPLNLFPVSGVPAGEKLFSPEKVKAVVKALHEVIEQGGTATQARVRGYEVAGKTGTAYIAGPNGYNGKWHRYVSSFVGMLPWPKPDLVVAVVLREPKKGHYGGQVAAPVFAKIAARTVRFFDRNE